MTLGGIDKSLAKSDIKYYDIDGKDYWALRAEKILIGDEDLNLCPDGCKLLFDTGTSLVTAPSSHLRQILPVLEDSVPDMCANFRDLPTIKFVI